MSQLVSVSKPNSPKPQRQFSIQHTKSVSLERFIFDLDKSTCSVEIHCHGNQQNILNGRKKSISNFFSFSKSVLRPRPYVRYEAARVTDRLVRYHGNRNNKFCDLGCKPVFTLRCIIDTCNHIYLSRCFRKSYLCRVGCNVVHGQLSLRSTYPLSIPLFFLATGNVVSKLRSAGHDGGKCSCPMCNFTYYQCIPCSPYAISADVPCVFQLLEVYNMFPLLMVSAVVPCVFQLLLRTMT